MSVDDDSAKPDRPLRVILLCFGLRGGMVDYCSHLANALASRSDVVVTVVAPATAETAAAFDSSVRLRTFGFGGEGWLDSVHHGLRAIWTITRHVADVDPDVVHDTTYGGFPSLVVLPLLALKDVTLVGTVHDPVPHSGHEIRVFGYEIKRRLIRRWSFLLSRIIVHGPESRRLAEEAGYPPERLRVLRHGTYEQFTDSMRGNAGAYEYDMLFFGNIRPNKGYDRVPELMDAVTERYGPVDALVAGTPDVHPSISEDQLSRILDGLRDHPSIELRDRYIPEEDVSDIFENCKLLVLPYHDASQSGVAQIGYAFEKPMVATETGDMGRMFRRDGTALLSDPDDTDELAGQIVRALDDDELRERLVKRVRDAKSDYSWDSIADETVELYRGLWEASPPDP